MTDDIVKRLRDTADIGVPDFTNSSIMREAADEIQKLRKQKHDISVALKNIRAENEKLRAALKFYDDDDNWRLNGPLDTNSGNFTGGPAKEVLGE